MTLSPTGFAGAAIPKRNMRIDAAIHRPSNETVDRTAQTPQMAYQATLANFTMRKPKLPKLTDAERHKRFVETATKVGASDKSEDFDKAFESLNIRKQTGKRPREGVSE
jgi:hypothetical protein